MFKFVVKVERALRVRVVPKIIIPLANKLNGRHIDQET